MALPASLSPAQLAKLDHKQRFAYFCENARYTDSPEERYQYAIRFGSKTLWSNDTADLRSQFDYACLKERRRRPRKAAR